jgi:hypothetical protein
MKARSLITAVGSGVAVVLAAALLAALPAYAGSGLIKKTTSDTPYKGGAQSAPSTAAKAQSKAKKAAPPEIQVGVMAKSPSKAPVRRAVFIRR